MNDNRNKEIPIYKNNNIDSLKKETYLVASVNYNNNEYYLYSNGKLYKNDENGKNVELDNSNEDDKRLIKEIMNMFKGGKTDIYMK